MIKLTLHLSLIIFISSLSSSLRGDSIPDEPEPSKSREAALNVFLECNCDINYTREEIPYVNYVRDVHEAQVYIRVTRQNTGSGGDRYTYSFQGLSKFEGMNDTLVYTSNPDMTWPVIREEQTNLLKIGLVRYIAKTPFINEVKIVNTSDFKPEVPEDKWNNWVFELRTSPRFNAE